MNDHEYLQAFANKHKLIFDDEGECGIGRECVGFRDGNWVDYNPINMTTFDLIEEHFNRDFRAPSGVEAYHKHNCLVVLGHGDEVIVQLATWIRHLESLGEIKIVSYETGAIGVQAMLSGVVGKCVSL